MSGLKCAKAHHDERQAKWNRWQVPNGTVQMGVNVYRRTKEKKPPEGTEQTYKKATT